ncbi:hypothetical protein J2S55_007216 [Streptosporangium brasiliense]|uniref:Uncharacterized protein n=1 Tax=Streptosporangium brasiliense TaxID=47480 RepID=A0ABT9RHX9_9ACTN|nr:hypothetical protein [Streptosporangium brasiliense]MDP9867950.1 hypothetical protein [Streptosporangium brasiliense]
MHGVVECAASIGVGCNPAATSPAMCVMSASTYAPTSSATALMRPKSIDRV